AAGDVDSDRRQDLLIGAPFADHNGRQGSGSVYIVTDIAAGGAIDLAAPARPTMGIDGAAALDLAGGSVAVADEFDGDARPDVLVGAAGADENARRDSGAAHLVSFDATQPAVALAALARPRA